MPIIHNVVEAYTLLLVSKWWLQIQLYTYIYIYIRLCKHAYYVCTPLDLLLISAIIRFAAQFFCPLYHAQAFGVDVPLRSTVLSRLIERPCGYLYICAWVADIPWCFQGCIVFLSDDVMALIGVH